MKVCTLFWIAEDRAQRCFKTEWTLGKNTYSDLSFLRVTCLIILIHWNFTHISIILSEQIEDVYSQMKFAYARKYSG